MADENQTSQPKAGQGPTKKKKILKNLGGSKKTKKPSIIIKTGVAEGPAKQNTTIKTFKISSGDVELKAKGGRAGYKGGGMSQRGLGRAFMKGGKV